MNLNFCEENSDSLKYSPVHIYTCAPIRSKLSTGCSCPILPPCSRQGDLHTPLGVSPGLAEGTGGLSTELWRVGELSWLCGQLRHSYGENEIALMSTCLGGSRSAAATALLAPCGPLWPRLTGCKLILVSIYTCGMAH